MLLAWVLQPIHLPVESFSPLERLIPMRYPGVDDHYIHVLERSLNTH